MPSWTHPQRGNLSLPSCMEDISSHTYYIGKGKTCKSTRTSQATVMLVGARKYALAGTPSPSGSRLRAFNSTDMLTKSQLRQVLGHLRHPQKGYQLPKGPQCPPMLCLIMATTLTLLPQRLIFPLLLKDLRQQYQEQGETMICLSKTYWNFNRKKKKYQITKSKDWISL